MIIPMTMMLAPWDLMMKFASKWTNLCLVYHLLSLQKFSKYLTFSTFPDDDDDEFASGSSDDDDYNTFQDPYVHTIDTEADTFVDDVDFCNVDRQGSAYERYKRRILREAEGLDSNSDDENDDPDESLFESASENGNKSD